MATQPATPARLEPFTTAPRIHRALTASIEQRLLRHLARRTPTYITSDHLTLLGFLAQLAAGLFYVLARFNPSLLILVCLFLVLNWLGDSLDGTLARIRNQQRPRYGFYVDHITDILGSTALMTGLAVSGYLHWPVALAMLVAFLLLASESFLATHTLGRFHLSAGLFGPTELRLLLIAGNLALLHSPYSNLFGHRFLLFDLGGILGTICMSFTLVSLAIRHTIELYCQEPLPPSPPTRGQQATTPVTNSY